MIDYYLLIPWFMFGTFFAFILGTSGHDAPQWYRRLPSEDARFVVCVGVVLLFPLLLVAGVTAGAFWIACSFGRGLFDVVQHVRPKRAPLPQARARRGHVR